MSTELLIESIQQLKNSIDTLCLLLEKRNKPKPAPEPAPPAKTWDNANFDPSKLKGPISEKQIKWIKGIIKADKALEMAVLEKFEVACIEDIEKKIFSDALAFVKQKKGIV